MKKDDSWCVTGINALTGKREIVSTPCSKDNAERLLEKAKIINPDIWCYSMPQVELVDNVSLNQ